MIAVDTCEFLKMQYSNNESAISASHHYMNYDYNQQYDNGNQMGNNAPTADENEMNSAGTFRELREVPRERDRRDRGKYDRDISRDRDRRRDRGQERSGHRAVPIVADYNYYYDETKARASTMTSAVVAPTETYPQNYVNYNVDASNEAANYTYYNNEAAPGNAVGIGRSGDNGGENSGDEYSFEGSNDSSYHDRHRRGRDRDRDRGRDRDYYDRDRDRDRGGRDRTRNRDRDRDRSRGRDRDRDRERDRDRSRDRERSRDRSRDRDRDRDWDRDYSSNRRDSYPNSWKDGTPNHTIMLRTLPLNDITKNDIRYEIAACGLEVKDVRLLRTRKGPNPDDKGTGRGFGFVEFKSVGDAMKFMEAKQGMLVVDDRKIPMHYSIHPKDEGTRERSSSDSNYKLTIDWDCIKCGAYNFRRRDHCFKCSTARDDAELSKFAEGHDEFSTTPRNTLLFGNLDALTTEETILVALQALTSLPIKSIRIAKDPLTNTSRGFCYVELNSTSEAIMLHNHLQNKDAPFYVDNRKVLVSYSKQSFFTSVSATSATVASTAVAAAQWTNQVADASVDPYGTAYNAAPTAGMPAYGNAASYYDQQQTLPHSVASDNSIPQATTLYQQQYYGANTATTTYSQVGAAGSVANTHTAAQMKVAPPSLNQALSSAESHSATGLAKNPIGMSYDRATISAPATAPATANSPSLNLASVGVPDASGDYTKYPVPDVSTYQFDQSTNYYYDSSTGLYYDASSQYYYNSQTQQFLYWDSDKQSYLLAPTNATTDEGSADASIDGQQTDAMPTPVKKGRDKDKQDKVKIAKKIAKDMEKWAKMLNQKKENAKQGFVANQAFAVDSLTKQPATADAGFAILEKKSTLAERQAAIMEAMRKKDLDEKKGNGKGKDGLVPEYGGGSDTDEDGEASGEGGGALDESRLTDWQKLACLLCKRMFPSKEALVRHQQLSDLHKQNLEALRMSVGQQGGNDQESKYRDRAKERREKYGEPDVPQPSKVKDKFAQRHTTNYEEPTKHGIGSSNIGNKMLKAMGWNEGQGLGKTNQGRTNIIEAQRRVATAGLGLRGSNYGTNTGDTYKETVKKMMQTRYNELE